MDGLDKILTELKAQGRNLNQLTVLANMERWELPLGQLQSDGVSFCRCDRIVLCEGLNEVVKLPPIGFPELLLCSEHFGVSGLRETVVTYKQKIEQRATNAGMTVTDYLTTCALGKKIVQVDGLDKILTELKAQGRRTPYHFIRIGGSRWIGPQTPNVADFSCCGHTSPAQPKTAIITARMTPEDKQKIEQRATNAGMTSCCGHTSPAQPLNAAQTASHG